MVVVDCRRINVEGKIEMEKGIISKILFLGIGALIMTGCGLAGPKFPTGDYIDTEGFITSYHVDGKSWVRNPTSNEILATHGEYSAEGEIITFAKNALCPDGDGIYEWSLDGEQLHFELIDDNCEARIWALSLEITRYKYDR